MVTTPLTPYTPTVVMPNKGRRINDPAHLQRFLTEAAALVKKDGWTLSVKEDGVWAPVTAVHLQKNQVTWHAFYKTSDPYVGGAADINIRRDGSTTAQRAAYIDKVLVPLAINYGIAYYREDYGTSNQHLHIDIGTVFNHSGSWKAAEWIGLPAVDLPVWRGKSNPSVGVIQEELGLVVDDVFGVKTDAAVRAFQKKYRLTVDGVVGPQTWKAMQA